MFELGVIGSAGRGTDASSLSAGVYWAMYRKLQATLERYNLTRIKAKSGGAAWADHLAISLFIRGAVKELELHLPAKFDFDTCRYVSAGHKSPGSTANYYHDKFTTTMGFKRHTLEAIKIVRDRGATILNHYDGFRPRNLEVGKVNLLVAFTFGRRSTINIERDAGRQNSHIAGLKDGGTAHTWEHSPAPMKIHYNLFELLEQAS